MKIGFKKLKKKLQSFANIIIITQITWYISFASLAFITCLIISEMEAQFDTFCYMLIEDFLMQKNMANTLSAFRSEWVRPEEVSSLIEVF